MSPIDPLTAPIPGSDRRSVGGVDLEVVRAGDARVKRMIYPVGFRWSDGWNISVWSRNLLNKDYFDLLTAAPGNTGLYVGQPGDPRTIGVTLRMTFTSK